MLFIQLHGVTMTNIINIVVIVTYLFYFRKPREMKFCTLKSEPFCNSIKALECLLVVVVFMIVSTKLYSTVHPVKRRPV